MASVISRIIGEITRQGFPCLFHLLTGLYCPGCGGTRAFRALLAGNLLLSIRYHPLVAYMAVVLAAELVSFAVSRAAKNPRYYLGHEKLLVYIGALPVKSRLHFGGKSRPVPVKRKNIRKGKHHGTTEESTKGERTCPHPSAKVG